MSTVLYHYLQKIQHPTTGLLESFACTSDPTLSQVAFTYDLALAALVFTHHGDFDRARLILEFYRSMPLPDARTRDYNTAYQTRCRLPALESAFQLGPMSWVALALMRYTEATSQRTYLGKAVELLDWARQHLDHFQGGAVMGVSDPWTSRMSVENNWVYYAALRSAAQLLADGPVREALTAERVGVRQWLAKHERRRGQDDAVKALDVYTHALLVGPGAHLQDAVHGDRRALARWAIDLTDELDALFRVQGSFAHDYTDAREAGRVGRPRMGWLEGGEQAALAYQTWAAFLEAEGYARYAAELRRRAGLAHAHVIRCSLLAGTGVAVPNTDAEEPMRTFADGWIARPCTEPAVNGTTWTYFVETGYNPFLVVQ